jgi:hypothetical protein
MLSVIPDICAPPGGTRSCLARGRRGPEPSPRPVRRSPAQTPSIPTDPIAMYTRRVPSNASARSRGSSRRVRRMCSPSGLPKARRALPWSRTSADQVQQPQRHPGIMPSQRSSLVSDPGRDFWHPTCLAGPACRDGSNVSARSVSVRQCERAPTHRHLCRTGWPRSTTSRPGWFVAPMRAPGGRCRGRFTTGGSSRVSHSPPSRLDPEQPRLREYRDEHTGSADSPLADEAVQARRVDDFASDESASLRRLR